MKKQTKKKDVSNEELARMVQGGFEAVDKRFDTVDREFQIVHHKIDTLARRIDAMVDYNRRIARLEKLVDSILKH